MEAKEHPRMPESSTPAPTATQAPGVVLSEIAAKEIHRIIEEQELDKAKVRLRVGVKGGGCSGFSYLLDLTETQKETDEVFVQHGVTIIVDPKSLLYLGGTTIDFRDEIMGRGFVFNNPNATSTCGCGSSFSA
jgi:iron-sulfur cluster assembly protein